MTNLSECGADNLKTDSGTDLSFEMELSMSQKLLEVRFRITCLLAFMVTSMMTFEVKADGPRWAMALHGGAGNVSREIAPQRLETYRQGLEHALKTGETILANGGTALDAVEQTVMALENESCFNAGKGAVFNSEGYHQLDASIMDGSGLACGAVSAVETVRNPVRAARLVMEKTPHVLLTGTGADTFASEQGLEIVPQSYYFDPVRWGQFNSSRKAAGHDLLDAPRYGLPKEASLPDPMRDHDVSRGTVGCVALDQHGHLAAATSTGGMTGKLPGRVGDSPIIGAGTYADDAGCAVSGTGNGEEYLRHAIAFQVNWRVREGRQSVEQAVRECLEKILKPGDGGLIAVDRQGNLTLQTNTKTLNRGWADSTGKRGIAIWDQPLE